MFDPLICDYHGLPDDFKHVSDMDPSKLKGNVNPEVPVHSVRSVKEGAGGKKKVNKRS